MPVPKIGDILQTTQMGIIFSSFSVGYAIFNFLGGMASDKFGAKLTLFVAMIVLSLNSGTPLGGAIAGPI